MSREDLGRECVPFETDEVMAIETFKDQGEEAMGQRGKITFPGT